MALGVAVTRFVATGWQRGPVGGELTGSACIDGRVGRWPGQRATWCWWVACGGSTRATLWQEAAVLDEVPAAEESGWHRFLNGFTVEKEGGLGASSAWRG
jgi:hypothetical protein